MVKSMTAYASVEKTTPEAVIGMEMRSYNSRYLDIVLRLPPGCAGLEDNIKRLISAKLLRGRIEARLQIKDLAESTHLYEVDLLKAKAYYAAALELKNALKLANAPALEQIMAVPGVLQAAESGPKVEAHWPLVVECMEQTLEALEEMRSKEGGYIAQDFNQRLDIIEKKLDQIENATVGLMDQYRDRLQSRIEALTKGLVDLDLARIAQEAAVIADRSDISEEIVRARSHLEQFRSIMNGEEAAGRKLNFLLQEFNREFNTMGGKIGQATAAHVIVDVKAEIEKLREQVQNIE